MRKRTSCDPGKAKSHRIRRRRREKRIKAEKRKKKKKKKKKKKRRAPDRHEILECLGSGTYGKKVKNLLENSKIQVLKQINIEGMNKSELDATLNECKVHGQCEHPHHQMPPPSLSAYLYLVMGMRVVTWQISLPRTGRRSSTLKRRRCGTTLFRS